ncbi:DUF2787 family protein [Vibrio aphrogenes]|uniref:DUF2787 family protein n=1 Tax=Vibrio aphrogenes TaxID=1891186 RepID=UPI000B34E5A8|nr:DUF2787 family protein [Vibrio aphrogenes]
MNKTPLNIVSPPFVDMDPEVRRYLNACLTDHLKVHDLSLRLEGATSLYFKFNDTSYCALDGGHRPTEYLIKRDKSHSALWHIAYIAQWAYLKPNHKALSRYLDFDFDSSTCFLPSTQCWQSMRSNFACLSLYAQWERRFLAQSKAGAYDQIRIHVF